MKTNIYVDAFNLYYGSLKGTPYRWLDLGKLARLLVPSHTIHRIRYFTALVTPITGKGDGQQAVRQQAYLRALRTIAELTVHEGHYQTTKASMRMVSPPATGSAFVRVFKTEEKGSDVNLATMLLADAFRDDFEQAVVVTNDSDLALPIDLVNRELRKAVGIAYPCTNPGRRRSEKLRLVARFVRDIRENALASSQFPGTVSDSVGAVVKPTKW